MSEFVNDEWYHCRVEPRVRWEISANKGTRMLILSYMVVEGDLAGQEIEGSLFLKTDDEGKARLFAQLALLGFDAARDNWYDMASKVAGHEVDVQVQVQDFKGNVRIRANRLAASGSRAGAGAEERAKGIIKEFAEAFANTNTYAGEPVKVGDDDIPF